ncbi:FecR family protein [Larkinella insperata]|uniref:FecR family protein n=1 Tax=Larkinella insperata TaxID=332158 RepID=A0ABW3QGR9_9BACT|nr:FecR family protein [Larkinella insperata]
MNIRPEDLPDLLKRYLEGRCTDEERAAIDAWYSHAGEQLPPIDKSRRAERQELVWRQIQEQITRENYPEPKHRSLWKNPFLRLAVAASLLLISGWVSYQLLRTDQSFENPIVQAGNIREVVNAGVTNKTVKLEDGSRITLHPGSRINYPHPFRPGIREVHLEGDAFFEVAKNKKKPFVVYTGEVATKVVGTSFLIRSDQQNPQDVVVSVMTGKVIVEHRERTPETRLPNSTNGVVLTPNQQVTYYHANKHFVTSLVVKPIAIKPQVELVKQRLFRFDGTPLREVLERMQAAYGLKFELINDGITNCPVTADLTEQPFFVKLDIIAESLNARYEVKGTSIVLSGGSCE